MRPRKKHRRRTPCVLLVALAAVFLVASAVEAKKQDPRLETLTNAHRQWLASVELIISDEEIEAFLSLEQEYQREAFIEKFWRIRDPYPDTARNEFKDRWETRLMEVVQIFGSVDGVRSEMMLLNGEPAARLEFVCSGVVWPLEVWFYDGSEKTPFEFFLVFVKRYGLRYFTLWYPNDGIQELIDDKSASSSSEPFWNAIFNCNNGRQVRQILQSLLADPNWYERVVARIRSPAHSPSPEWVATFESYSTDLPEDARVFPAELTLSFPDRYQSRTVLQGLLTVPLEEAGLSELAEDKSYHFMLAGEILREERLFENFRYKFDFPAADIGGNQIPISFERRLRPGAYKLIVRLEDITSGRFFRAERDLEVPKLETSAPSIPLDAESARILEAAAAAITVGETTLKIVPPRGEMLSGMVRFDTLTTGDDIAEIEFTLDERTTLRKRKPPFSVELDMGSVPRTHTLSATARNREGVEVARDEIVLNAGEHRFSVRLVEPRPGVKYTDSVQAVAEVIVPKDSVVVRVEFYLNEDLIATLFQPPFIQSIHLPDPGTLAYVRAVAFRPDDSSTEDLVFVNTPDYLEEVEIEFVELYTSVLDKDRRPVLNLGQEAFRVMEDGKPQTIVRFDVVRDLPIHAGILLDVSASMEGSILQARDAALQFFEDSITEKDRAALITFNDHPQLAVKFTNDSSEMAAGLAGIKAERGTALYDSLIFSLYYFNGIKGQRVLLVLSDGKDENSRFSLEDALEYAHRTGVAIYAIGLNIEGKGAGLAKKALQKIATETGGRAFFVKDAAELSAIYRAVQEELRSRYLIGYQSSNNTNSTQFREVVVEVAGKGLEAQTIRGYYP